MHNSRLPNCIPYFFSSKIFRSSRDENVNKNNLFFSEKLISEKNLPAPTNICHIYKSKKFSEFDETYARIPDNAEIQSPH